jgi:hypothetical protein
MYFNATGIAFLHTTYDVHRTQYTGIRSMLVSSLESILVYLSSLYFTCEYVSLEGSTMQYDSSLQKLVKKAVMIAALFVDKKSPKRSRQIGLCNVELDVGR